MARTRKKTGFDKFFDDRMKNKEFRTGYDEARSEIDRVDALVRALDAARIDVGLSKADLARKVATSPEALRRLFTADHANPTLATFVKLAAALGYQVSLMPNRGGVAAARPRKQSSRTAAASSR
jgi:DNA-binding phage protein